MNSVNMVSLAHCLRLAAVVGVLSLHSVAAASQTVGTVRFSDVAVTTAADNTAALMVLQGDVFAVEGFTLRELIRYAFATRGVVTDAQIIGLPAWASRTRFNIRARVHASRPLTDLSLAMPELANLVSAEFALQYRLSQGVVVGFALSEYSSAVEHPTVFRGDCATLRFGQCGTHGTRAGVLLGKGATMDELARSLQALDELGRPVLNATRRSGRFEWHVEYSPGGSTEQPQLSAQPNSLLAQLQKKLGLTLVRRNVEVLTLKVQSASLPKKS